MSGEKNATVEPKVQGFGARPFHDVSDGLAGSPSHDGRQSRDQSTGLVIHFNHVPTGKTCHFKAFLTAFEDVFESQWNEEEVFGRMDPISTFKRTRRRIRLGWDVPAASEEEAILNLKESEKLVSMLYPVFEIRNAYNFLNGGETGQVTEPTADRRRVGVMVAPPLFKIKFANLIMDGEKGQIAGDAGEAAATSGLVGTISGLSYRPDIDQGFFGGFQGTDPVTGEDLNRKIVAGTLIPQTISFDIEFTVHHQHGMGFSLASLTNEKEGQENQQTPRKRLTGRRANGFPYRADKILRSNR